MICRLSLACALVACAAAIPILPPDASACPTGQICNQSIDSGIVSVGSSVSAVPVTQVTPITNYQPVVHALAPIVTSECNNILGGGLGGLGGMGDLGLRGGHAGNLGIGGNLGLEGGPPGGFGGNFAGDLGLGGGIPGRLGGNFAGSLGLGGGLSGGIGGNFAGPGLAGIGANGGGQMRKRKMKRQFGLPAGTTDASFLQSTDPAASCAPSDVACIANLPQQTVDLGSAVTAVPQTNVLPSTTFQSQVQSLDSNIQAAPAQQSSLPEQSVNMGHSTFIQPTTQVLPQTSYQPTVNQLTTEIQAAAVQDQSLPQSSPTIQSLPFIINAAPCVNTAQFTGASFGAAAAAPFASSFGASSIGTGSPFGASSVGCPPFGSQVGTMDQAPATQGQSIAGLDQGSGQGFAGVGLAGQVGQPLMGQGLGLGGRFQGQIA
ncbi:hypothetical protein BGZ92_011007 [Podila epicladia]|nr:hypothetical protein BGZ92_011007 [Podila epicladia]